MFKHLAIKIYGRVQGVGFRYFVKDKAQKFSILGFVENEAGTSVYIEAEGESENLTEFTRFCSRGPSDAKIDRIEIQEGNLKNFKTFEIK